MFDFLDTEVNGVDVMLVYGLLAMIGCFALGYMIGAAHGELQCIDFNKPLYQHIHVQVTGIDIPKNVGITPGCFMEIHTHSTSGILHLESNAPKNFTLGEFFDLWGKNMTGLVEINGEPATFQTILKDQDKIVIQ